MTVFVVLAAAMVLAALVMLLRPLLAKPGNLRNPRASLDSAREADIGLRHRHSDGSLSAEEYERARSRLALDLLDSVSPAEDQGGSPRLPANLISAAVIAVLVPAVATALYWKLGASDMMTATAMSKRTTIFWTTIWTD